MADQWKSLPKHYCELCKCWMADNKASREFHEEGSRHKENVQKRISDLYERENEKARNEEKLKRDMHLINSAAYKGMLEDIARDPSSAARYGFELNNKMKKDLEDIKKQKAKTSQITKTNSLWKPAKTKEGHVYYWNVNTKETKWECPNNIEDDCVQNLKVDVKCSENASVSDFKNSVNSDVIKNKSSDYQKPRIIFNPSKRSTVEKPEDSDNSVSKIRKM